MIDDSESGGSGVLTLEEVQRQLSTIRRIDGRIHHGRARGILIASVLFDLIDTSASTKHYHLETGPARVASVSRRSIRLFKYRIWDPRSTVSLWDESQDEKVMKQVKAKYVTGLTATPTRKEGDHPII